jgi:5,5'-dehydrodivanillate O-demethylase
VTQTPSLSDTIAPSALRVDQCGPDTLSGRYMRRFWTPVALLDDVAPGRARDIHILNEHFTYYRGTTGTPHLIAQLCPHRHVQLSLGWVEDDCLRCIYHGWKYDASGQCIEQPAERESFARKVQVPSYPVRVEHGLVFAYLGPGEPPPFPSLAMLDKPGTIRPSSYVRQTNFLNAIENNADWIHLAFVHRRTAFADAGMNRELPMVDAEETKYGISGRCVYSDGNETRFHILMPLGSYLGVLYTTVDEPAEHVTWRVPIDDTSHRSFIIAHVNFTPEALARFDQRKEDEKRLQQSLPPAGEIVDAIVRGDLHLDEVSRLRPDLLGIQDTSVMITQPPIGDRDSDQLGRSDVAIIKLRRLWYREIEAFAAGATPTAWDWDADLTVTLG